MIVTKEWLNEFVDLSNISTQKICEALNSIGLEVDSVNKPNISDGVVVGFVKECEKHPDADKLNVCQVDIGTEIVQIVCGAKNVAAGQFVPVATVGTILGVDFKIKKAKLRGEDSFGMICSTTEIGLAKLNDGILELDDSIGELKLGKNINEYPLLDDTVIEIELTANRGDCLCINGVAKDLCAYFNIPLKELDLTINEDVRAIGRILDVDYSGEVNANLLYKVVDTKNLDISLLCKLRVATIDKSKNTDIETIIEYASHSTGVLLNVYTQNITQKEDKIHLKIHNDENGFTSIDGNVPLSKVAIEAGEIIKDDDTVVIEASYTEPTTLAQNVFNTKQKTGDIYYKSSRGSNPALEYGMDYITHILSMKGSSIYKGQIDFQSELKEKTLGISINRINKIIGQEIDHLKIENILISLGFKVKNSTDDDMTIIIPATRHDILNIADITEEIVRMIGIDNIKAVPLKIAEVNAINKISYDLIKKNKLRTKAISNNFYETITYVYSSKDLLTKYGFETVRDNLDILNPINGDLNTFRSTMFLNHIIAVSNNVKQGFKSVALFENGIVFDKDRNESKITSFVFSGVKEEESLQNSGKSSNIDLFEFGQKLTNIIGKFDLEVSTNINNKFFHPYQCANIMQNKKIIGLISKIHPNVAKDFDISDDTYVAQINFDDLEDELVSANSISKFQTSKRDLSIVVPKDLEFKIIKNLIDSLNLVNLVQYNLVDIYNDEKLGDNESLTIRFVLQSNDKTLEENDINEIMDTLVSKLEEKLNITLR